MNTSAGNILTNLPDAIPDELFENLIHTDHLRIERIISQGQTTPQDQWYDQEWNEWVMVVRGRAELIFENRNAPVTLNEGDYINIPAHVKHRVSRTDPEEQTVWLAIHYR